MIITKREVITDEKLYTQEIHLYKELESKKHSTINLLIYINNSI